MHTSLCRFCTIKRSLGVHALNPWGLVGNLKFELSYAKATLRRHLRQLDVVFVVILD